MPGAPVRAHDDEIRPGALRDERLAGVTLDEPPLDRHRRLRAQGVGDRVVESQPRGVVLRAQLARQVARRNRQDPGIAQRLRRDEQPRMHSDEPRLPKRCLLGTEAERLA